jgi:hypothetical protein
LRQGRSAGIKAEHVDAAALHLRQTLHSPTKLL